MTTHSNILAWNILWTELCIYMFTMQIFFFFFFANGFCQLITYLGYLSLSPYIAPLSLFRVCIASYCIDGP